MISYNARMASESISRSINQVSGAIDNLSSAVEVAAAKEDLAVAMLTLNDMSRVMDALDLAQRSLNNYGYSEEWLNTMNFDGTFLDAIGVNKLDLIGSDQNKFDASMEGIMTTIWDWIKSLWKWIVGIMRKILDFIKKVIYVLKTDDNTAKRLDGLVGVVANNMTPEEYKQIGININQLGHGSFVNFDTLVTRTGCNLAIAEWLAKNIIPVVGLDRGRIADLIEKLGSGDEMNFYIAMVQMAQGSGKSITSKYTEELINDVKMMRDISHKNPMSLELKDVLDNRPAELGQIMTSNKTKVGLIDATSFVKLADAVGISISCDRNTGDIRIERKPLDTVDSVDYTNFITGFSRITEVSTSFMQYSKISGKKFESLYGSTRRMETVAQDLSGFINASNGAAANFAAQLKEALASGQLSPEGQSNVYKLANKHDEWIYPFVKVVRHHSNCISKLIPVVASCINDALACRARMDGIAKVISQTIQQFKH